MMLSDVCLSVAYIGPKSRTERHRKTKMAQRYVTRDSDTTFKVKRSKPQRSRSQGAGHIVAAPAQIVFVSVLQPMRTRKPINNRLNIDYDHSATTPEKMSI